MPSANWATNKAPVFRLRWSCGEKNTCVHVGYVQVSSNLSALVHRRQAGVHASVCLVSHEHQKKLYACVCETERTGVEIFRLENSTSKKPVNNIVILPKFNKN